MKLNMHGGFNSLLMQHLTKKKKSFFEEVAPVDRSDWRLWEKKRLPVCAGSSVYDVNVCVFHVEHHPEALRFDSGCLFDLAAPCGVTHHLR